MLLSQHFGRLHYFLPKKMPNTKLCNGLQKMEKRLHPPIGHPSQFSTSRIGSELMDFAENLAMEEKALSVWLDTFSQNKSNASMKPEAISA